MLILQSFHGIQQAGGCLFSEVGNPYITNMAVAIRTYTSHFDHITFKGDIKRCKITAFDGHCDFTSYFATHQINRFSKCHAKDVLAINTNNQITRYDARFGGWRIVNR